MSEGPLCLLPSLTHPSPHASFRVHSFISGFRGCHPSHLLSGALPTSSSPAPRMLSRRGHPLAGRVPTPTAPMGSQVYQLIPAPGRLAGEQAGRGAGRGRVWLGLLGGGWYIFQLRWCLLHVPRLSPSRGQNTDMLLMARCMSGPPGGCH